MNVQLSHPDTNLFAEIQITGSKSESNRALILKALYPSISLSNLSNSDDTSVLQKVLSAKEGTVDIHHAGTAMRFLTAYFASREGVEVVLTGSSRMQERPIKLLVDALKMLGAEISYLNEEGFPPIKITGKKFQKSSVRVQANISSQYISALMLIGASLPEGLSINLEGPVTSAPYINMTLELLHYFEIEAEFEGQLITIQPKNKVQAKTFEIESDWSSASYYFSIAALGKQAQLNLKNYKQESLQGDSNIIPIYKEFGIETSFTANEIQLLKNTSKKPKSLHLDLQNMPDLAQTIAVTCLGLGIGCELKGLHTLKIKETDRLVALKNELEKFGAVVEITNNSLSLAACAILKENIEVETYNDHRMAMAFAPLALKVPLTIKDAGVVSKSYPEFWEDLESIGFSVEKV
ncbi:3-phosphoshikimate 1-carboxyvinyltransferase [Gillisia mitskevichiae]|uniref:3-phosphoshikimate 1-carboxyvinyltransferase n=1 Tax=Gillisia mitskevichiae TaxID=270921 RepID=A0A495Q021_9FLAO|nr:3-phosphoshikimate 1-carboxyvinyltransferase [Gillisia mitskevichiae]RKS56143.1 3-phosphoshikimate 1-carboxyvinyltransferase [Gillisia mitskevichiae]